MITAEQLRSLLDYDPATGILTWKVRAEASFTTLAAARSWNTKYAGLEALTALSFDGYRIGSCLGEGVRAHRVIWVIMTGEWPSGEIDHINGIRSDNRWCNLRDVSKVENGRNTWMRSTNTTGVTGVFWRRDNSKWVAKIRADGKLKHLGCFEAFEEAVAAREQALREHGYSERHGKPRALKQTRSRA
jgi:hypothetical protein